jgi:uncharacterized protein YeaO (DUF488 family)
MKTSYFSGYKGKGGISVARYNPRFIKNIVSCRKLAPGSWFNSVSEEEYIKRYFDEILSKLDPQKVWEELHKLAGDNEPVLLCYEKPSDFCHRHLIAEWFYTELGEEVEEYSKKILTLEDF